MHHFAAELQKSEAQFLILVAMPLHSVFCIIRIVYFAHQSLTAIRDWKLNAARMLWFNLWLCNVAHLLTALQSAICIAVA